MDHQPVSYVVQEKYTLLETSLEDILAFINPSDEDKLKRERTIEKLVLVLRDVKNLKLKGATLQPFGSFVSNIYTKWGDLDISLQLKTDSMEPCDRKLKESSLQSMMSAIKKSGEGRQFECILRARVPILKFNSSLWDISCDISVDNYAGVLKSQLLLYITQMDRRIRDLVLLIKEWAKAHEINDPKSGTLNSYSLCLLVIFHLQTCEPAILPPLKDIFPFNDFNITGREPYNEIAVHNICKTAIAAFRSLNRNSLSELLISFFTKFSSIGTRSFDYTICPYTGRWEPIRSKQRWVHKQYALYIEDPWAQQENAARSVGPVELQKISYAISVTDGRLKTQWILSDKEHLLNSLVRPSIKESLQINRGIRWQHSGGGTNLHSQFEAMRLSVDRRPSSSKSHPSQDDAPNWTPNNSYR